MQVVSILDIAERRHREAMLGCIGILHLHSAIGWVKKAKVDFLKSAIHLNNIKQQFNSNPA